MYNKIPSLKSLFPAISYTLLEFKEILKQKFSLTQEDALKVSRLIFEAESALLNGKVQFKEDKS